MCVCMCVCVRVCVYESVCVWSFHTKLINFNKSEKHMKNYFKFDKGSTGYYVQVAWQNWTISQVLNWHSLHLKHKHLQLILQQSLHDNWYSTTQDVITVTAYTSGNWLMLIMTSVHLVHLNWSSFKSKKHTKHTHTHTHKNHICHHCLGIDDNNSNYRTDW